MMRQRILRAASGAPQGDGKEGKDYAADSGDDKTGLGAV